MKKIVVGKTKGIAEVIDDILSDPDTDIVLVIPKASALAKSVSNFRLLKREVGSAGRTVTIESVDDTVLAFAKESGIEASHPLWRGTKTSGGVSDIVSREDSRPASAPATERPERMEPEDDEERANLGKRVRVKVESAEMEVEEAEQEEEKKEERAMDMFSRSYDESDEDEVARGMWGLPWMSRGLAMVAGIVIVIALIGIYITTAFFNHADIVIDFQKQPWTFQNNFVADKAATGINSAASVIPAQIFTDSKNITQTFPGSSFSTVSLKAHGTITIYNNYSAAPQELVATTRFLTPDGKIFRIVNNVTVPGATVTNGKIKPSSIDASIVADAAGPDYNIGPVSHLSIPGFQGTPRATGFYGVTTASTTGGFVGRKATPTAADIADAKTKVTATLQSSLQGGFSGNYPNSFKILDGATSIQVTKLVVSTTTDDKGNFSVFGEAALSAIGFDESALKTYLLSLAQKQESNSVFSALTLSYSNVQANFPKGQLSFTLAGQGTLEPSFSVDDFRTSIMGKSISNARSSISGLTGLADGKISVWPFWLWSIPSDASKVHITAN